VAESLFELRRIVFCDFEFMRVFTADSAYLINGARAFKIPKVLPAARDSAGRTPTLGRSFSL
jgi:hypothetical protein